MNSENVVVAGIRKGYVDTRAVTDAEVLTMVLAVEDQSVLATIVGVAREKLENMRLRGRTEWLERRIAEEERDFPMSDAFDALKPSRR
ncbi:MAG: hypothetical protein IKG22_10125 [Atopobiaceae bacterium]|nr:hypothetical protein [Atopobiaceae bacterium]